MPDVLEIVDGPTIVIATTATIEVGAPGPKGDNGDIVGPVSSTDNAWARWNGTGGSTLQNGTWIEDDSGNVTAGGNLAMSGNDVSNLVLKNATLEDYAETINAIGSIGGGTQDLDLSIANVHTGTVDTSATTFTVSNVPTGAVSFTLVLTNGGSQTINWMSGTQWSYSTAPTLAASGVDILEFFTLNGGTTWYGFHAGQDMGAP